MRSSSRWSSSIHDDDSTRSNSSIHDDDSTKSSNNSLVHHLLASPSSVAPLDAAPQASPQDDAPPTVEALPLASSPRNTDDGSTSSSSSWSSSIHVVGSMWSSSIHGDGSMRSSSSWCSSIHDVGSTRSNSIHDDPM